MNHYDDWEVDMFFFLQLFLIPNDISKEIKEQLLLDIQKAIHSVEGLKTLEIGIALIPDQIPYELGSEIIGRGEYCGFKPSADQFFEAGRKVFNCLKKFAREQINDPERLAKPKMARCRIINLRLTIVDFHDEDSVWYGHERTG